MPFATAGGLRIPDLEGALIIVEVNKLETGITSTLGGDPYDALDCDVHVCDGPHAGKTEHGMRISGKVLRAQLEPLIGQKKPRFLGRVVLITGGRRPYRKLGAVSAEDTALALGVFPQFADDEHSPAPAKTATTQPDDAPF